MQIQRFVQLHQQKDYCGTAEANNVCLASASAIILLTAFELKFEHCCADKASNNIKQCTRSSKVTPSINQLLQIF